MFNEIFLEKKTFSVNRKFVILMSNEHSIEYDSLEIIHPVQIELGISSSKDSKC